MVPEIYAAKHKVFCHYGSFFFHLTFLTTKNMKILKKLKTLPGDNIILKLCTTNDNHIIFGLWDIKRTKHNFLSFCTTFCRFTPLTTQKIKLKKIKKEKKKNNFWRYYHFISPYHKLWLDDAWFLRYGAWQMDGQMDGRRTKGRKKWHIEVNAPPKN